MKHIILLTLSLFITTYAEAKKPATALKTPAASSIATNKAFSKVPLLMVKGCVGTCIQAAQALLSIAQIRVINRSSKDNQAVKVLLNSLPNIKARLNQGIMTAKQAKDTVQALVAAAVQSAAWEVKNQQNLVAFLNSIATNPTSQQAKLQKVRVECQI